MSGEFALISRHFDGARWRELCAASRGVALGVGDDAALLAPRSGSQLALSTDAAVEGCHFPAGSAPRDIATRALGAALSDLAAMGASPLCFTVSLTMPSASPSWLEEFSAGLFEVASRHAVPLAGGDTTRGPLCVAIQVAGEVARGRALLRGGASPGDDVYVSGELGKGAAGLRALQQGAAAADLADAYWRPRPRLELGASLAGVASAAIDISDGLLIDLGHIAEASSCGATVAVEALPLCRAARDHCRVGELRQWALSGGDDYELCFAAPPSQRRALRAAPFADCTRIGSLSGSFEGVVCELEGRPFAAAERGHQHF